MTQAGAAVSSSRVALADAAEKAVMGTPGVALAAGRNLGWQTVTRDRRIAGITAVAQGDGRFQIGLHVVVEWPAQPLLPLAEDLRRRVRVAVERANLAQRLGDVDVEIVGIEVHEPSEVGP
jgi:hypothetical protein